MRAHAALSLCMSPHSKGATPYRKSLFDSLLFGCIPVTFSRHYELYAPWHLGGVDDRFNFRSNSHVFIDGDAYVRGEVDLFETLTAISDDQIEQMQASLPPPDFANRIRPEDSHEGAVRGGGELNLGAHWGMR